MPYIPDLKQRARLDRDLLPASEGIITDGDLNYAITRLVDAWLSRVGICYDTISDVVKALECAKLEFYRRIAAPYESQKCYTNGDVYRTAADLRPQPDHSAVSRTGHPDGVIGCGCV